MIGIHRFCKCYKITIIKIGLNNYILDNLYKIKRFYMKKALIYH